MHSDQHPAPNADTGKPAQSKKSEKKTSQKTSAIPLPRTRKNTNNKQSDRPDLHTGGPLLDTFARVADDLRLSVTDRCNLRCMYCMPADGLPWLPRTELLTYEEATRLTALFVQLGVRTIRVTGGEPLVRHNLHILIAQLNAITPRPELALTTNAVLLEEQADKLAEAGLDRVNVSLDSLQQDRFIRITRSDNLEKVLRGIRAAKAAGLTPVKVNCVVMRGMNADEVPAFARMAQEEGCIVRFIEYMPLDADGQWKEKAVFTAEEILDSLEKAGHDVVALSSEGPHPASRFLVDGEGQIGIIPSVTRPFCSTCNRLRITAEGGLRTCLFALEETNLRDPLRAGSNDAELEALIRAAVWKKWAGHNIGMPDFVKPNKSMSQIGG